MCVSVCVSEYEYMHMCCSPVTLSLDSPFPPLPPPLVPSPLRGPPTVVSPHWGRRTPTSWRHQGHTAVSGKVGGGEREEEEGGSLIHLDVHNARSK